MIAEGPLDVSDIVKYFNLNNALAIQCNVHLVPVHIFPKYFFKQIPVALFGSCCSGDDLKSPRKPAVLFFFVFSGATRDVF